MTRVGDAAPTVTLVHAVLQPPQFEGSGFKSTQLLPQRDAPPPQTTAHVPCEQTSLLPQTLPQVPQFW